MRHRIQGKLKPHYQIKSLSLLRLQSVFVSSNVGRGFEKYCQMITCFIVLMSLVFKMSACCLSVLQSRPLNIFLLPPSGSCAQSVHVFGEGSECVDGEVHTTSLSLFAANPQTVRDTASATGGTADCRYLILKLESALKLLILGLACDCLEVI